MSSAVPSPGPGEPEKKLRADRDARDMAGWVRRMCERTGKVVPPYDFIELIGKGASGRVYKAREQATGDLVAIKIVNTDDIDYSADSRERDLTIRDFRTEVGTLRKLKDADAKNVNMIHDAFDLSEQLWIVSDYCTGGSVRTLMRAQPPEHPGLDEQYIIIIARELALAINSVHEISIIHRDIKGTNVYINEHGAIQLGDFGIVGVTDEVTNKRSTMIGTPHYMPREMHIQGPDESGTKVMEAYGTEVDIWAFGCTVYEMATGLPPNARIDPRYFAQILQNAPRLEGDEFSPGLKDFIAFCLTSDPHSRPTAEQVLKHPYIANTNRSHPTSNLVKLIERYKVWELGGGFRHSLFYPGGAPPVAGTEEQGSEDTDDDNTEDWNFSTSDTFNERFDARYSQMIDTKDFGAVTAQVSQPPNVQPLITPEMTPLERMRQQQRQQHQAQSAVRGESSLNRLWDPTGAPYEHHPAMEAPTMPPPNYDISAPREDLPLRQNYNGGQTRESVIDLDTVGDIDSVPELDLDLATVKARSSTMQLAYSDDTTADEQDDDAPYGSSYSFDDKRATMEWKFPTARPATQEASKRATMEWTFPSTARPVAEQEEGEEEMNLPSIGGSGPTAPGFRPSLKHTVTEPLGQFGDFLHTAPTSAQRPPSPTRDSMASLIDLDLSTPEPSMSFSHVHRPSTASSASGSVMTDKTSGNPFDLEDDDSPAASLSDRLSHHKHWQSDGGQTNRSSIRGMPMHSRSNSLSEHESESNPRASQMSNLNLYAGFASNTLREEITHALGAAEPGSPWNSGRRPIQPQPTSAPEPFHDTNDPDAAERSSTITELPPFSDVPAPSNGSRYRRRFPDLVGPDPRALTDDADPDFLAAEVNRLLGDLAEAFDQTAEAFRRHPDYAGEPVDTGSERGGSPTEDDEEYERTR